MSAPTVAPFGAWPSPVTAGRITAGSVQFQQLAVDGDSIFWVEGRPLESGCHAIVRCAGDGAIEEVTARDFNARTTVHEYGGGAVLAADGVVFSSNFSDQRLYRIERGRPPRPITPEGALRFADATLDRARHRLICVSEDHSNRSAEAVNRIVGVDVHGRTAPAALADGYDFCSSPCLSPSGRHLAWLAWNHPNMPWDGTELWVAAIASNGSLAQRRRIAGGPHESILQPSWSPAGELYFVSDRSGWWNLHRERRGRVEPVSPMAAEVGGAAWIFGLSSYAFVAPDRLVCVITKQAQDRLAWIDVGTGACTPIATPYTSINFVAASRGRIVCVAAAPDQAPAVVRIDAATGASEVVRRGSDLSIDADFIARAEAIEFPTERGLTAHAFYYPPTNPSFTAPPCEKPPLIVHSHGGPTGDAPNTLSPSTLYWTSRGFAVVDVNYGGSTGFGTAYRRRLNGQWGVVDVDDCVNAARYLVARGDADPQRLAIAGGSAGGYTTLCALAFRRVFQAGASHFGVSNAEALARDTHKFESRYLDTLIAPYPSRADLYRMRSPVHAADQLACPVIFFQGLDDKIVPPDQSERMAAALRAKGLPVAYVAFPGEQHGFRRAENIQRALEGELYFYGRIFGFSPADPIEPVPIDNLPGG
ncbi:MAG: S9 family peptidase [Actinobacteria bacterium]|nr:S9 family peptidase [Actinomycetota bacterium]